MAETLISPGVLAQENDNSFIAPAPLAAGAAIIGPTVKGPAVQPCNRKLQGLKPLRLLPVG